MSGYYVNNAGKLVMQEPYSGFCYYISGVNELSNGHPYLVNELRTRYRYK